MMIPLNRNKKASGVVFQRDNKDRNAGPKVQCVTLRETDNIGIIELIYLVSDIIGFVVVRGILI